MEQEQPARVGRRLAAIVAADVAGYSRLMGLDEVGTARTLREHRAVCDPLVAKHGGRIVKTTGDGVLLEFPSVVDAVECVVAVQAVMAQRNEGVPQDRSMLFRIGINLGDILIEGGNSYYVDDIRRANELASKGINYVDVGTSGGVWGLERGYCMMIGGPEAAVRHLDPIFKTLAPGTGDIPRTPGREKIDGTAELGYLHCGGNGAGHFVKMVHNGIEYGIMAAYAEGMNILRHANVGEQKHTTDAETTALRNPELYRYDLNLRDIAEVWRRGSVIASWLLDLIAAGLVKYPALESFVGRVSDSGEGRWTIKAAIDAAVPVPVLSTALYERFSSRGEATFADKLLSAMRYEFGGHVEKPAG